MHGGIGGEREKRRVLTHREPTTKHEGFNAWEEGNPKEIMWTRRGEKEEQSQKHHALGPPSDTEKAVQIHLEGRKRGRVIQGTAAKGKRQPASRHQRPRGGPNSAVLAKGQRNKREERRDPIEEQSEDIAR